MQYRYMIHFAINDQTFLDILLPEIRDNKSFSQRSRKKMREKEIRLEKGILE